MDRRLLMVIIEHYEGGPVGIDTIAAALSEPRDIETETTGRTGSNMGTPGVRL